MVGSLRERDATSLVDWGANVLQQRGAPDPLASAPFSPPAPHQEPVVWVSVSGRRLALPERALCAGLSDLRLATEARAGVADYAAGVALVLSALETRGIVVFPS